MGLYSAGIADKMRDFPLALLRPYSVTGFTPPESPMKRGSLPSHYSARCWDGLFLRRNLKCNTDSSVRTTPPDAGKGLLRPMRGRAFTPPGSAMNSRTFRSHYCALGWNGLVLRRILQCNEKSSAHITPPHAGTGFCSAGICDRMSGTPLALLRPMPGQAFLGRNLQ